MVEYMRQLSMEEVLRVGSILGEPRLALYQAVLAGKEESEIVRCKEEVLRLHLSESLKMWLEWSNAEQRKDKAIDAHSSCE